MTTAHWIHAIAPVTGTYETVTSMTLDGDGHELRDNSATSPLISSTRSAAGLGRGARLLELRALLQLRLRR